MNNLITAVRFAEMFNYSKDLTYVARANGNPYIFEKDSIIYIDVDKLVYRREFETRLRKLCINYYYEVTKSIRQQDIARELVKTYGGTTNSWNIFISISLFSSAYLNKSLLAYKHSKRLWRFYKVIRKLYRQRKLNGTRV